VVLLKFQVFWDLTLYRGPLVPHISKGSVLNFVVEQSKKSDYWDCLSQKMKTLQSLEMLATTHPTKLRQIVEDWNLQRV